MSIYLWVALITFIAGVVGTGLGGVISALIRKDSKKTVSLFLSFAAGVMLAVVCFSLIDDAFFPVEGGEQASLWLVMLGIALGFVIVAVLNYLIDKSTNHEIAHVDKKHPKTADDLDELIHSDHYNVHKSESQNLFVAGIIMAAAIALHNLPEGMVIGAAYANSDTTTLMTGSGIIIACIIGLHNVPEGMAVAVPLIAGGMPKLKAILMTSLSGLPTVIGAMLGLLLGSLSPMWNTLSLSFASGAMLYVVFGELLPESILMWKSKLPAFAVIIGMLLGIGITYA